jgi:ABC-type glycerol-3-phosphate transport system permease component
MSLGSRLGMEDKGMFATFIFYAAVGIIFLALLPLTGFPPQIGIIGIFSLVVAYGMFRKRNWAIWFIVVLFFVATTFSVYMLYYYLPKDYLLAASIMVYLILTWIFTAYSATKRRSLEG